jgi:hypothetical protein
LLRKDITLKVISLLYREFPWIDGLDGSLLCEEHHTFEELGFSMSDVRDFREALLKECEVDIPLSEAMKWYRVSDCIDFIEESLRMALHDMPYISGFEPEA